MSIKTLLVVSCVIILLILVITGAIYMRGIIKMPICNDFGIKNVFECAVKADNLVYFKGG